MKCSQSEPPFKSDNDQAVIYSILHEYPEDLHDDLPEKLTLIIERTLSKNPRKRYLNIEEALLDLHSVAENVKSGKLGQRRFIGRLTRKQRAYLKRIAPVLMVLIIALGLYLWPRHKVNSKQVSIAVLPFRSLTNDPTQEWFADGTTSEIYTTLGNVSGLHVISLSSTMQYKEKRPSMDEIIKELGVDFVIEGTLALFENSFRINANIVNARKDAQVWGKSYWGEISKSLILQSEIAQNIIEQVKVKTNSQESRAASQMFKKSILRHIRRI